MREAIKRLKRHVNFLCCESKYLRPYLHAYKSRFDNIIYHPVYSRQASFDNEGLATSTDAESAEANRKNIMSTE